MSVTRELFQAGPATVGRPTTAVLGGLWAAPVSRRGLFGHAGLIALLVAGCAEKPVSVMRPEVSPPPDSDLPDSSPRADRESEPWLDGTFWRDGTGWVE